MIVEATSCCRTCPHPCLLAALFEPLLFPLVLQSCIARCSCGVTLVTLALARADLSSVIGDTDHIVAWAASERP
jgi:hypothetical protein